MKNKIDFLISKNLFFKILAGFYAILFFCNYSLFSQENFVPLNKAAEIFQKEKKEIRNYKVKQEVTSTIKESSGNVVEKRIQTGYFIYPDEYVFSCKDLEVNGIKQFLAKPLVERTFKSELDWLSKEGLNLHKFQTLSMDGKIAKYLVTPLKIQSGYYRGQIWIHQDSAKIIKILKEPVIKKKELLKYSIELNFDSNFPFQMPSNTKLNSIYQVNNRSTEITVEVRFESYAFNTDITKEIPR